MTALAKISPGEVVTAEQSKWIDRANTYLNATIESERQRCMYLYLTGVCLHQIKEGCEHGQFENLKLKHFPEEHGSRLTRAMQFAEAVNYLGKGKCPTVGNLAEGQYLLTHSALTEAEKTKLQQEVDKATAGCGVMKTIAMWRKKTAPKPPPMDAVRAEQQHQLMIEQSFEDAKAKLEWVLHFADADYVLASRAARNALAAVCVRFGKRNRALKPKKGGKA